MTPDERIKLIEGRQFPSIFSYQECGHCGLISNDLSLARVMKPCSSCGKPGPRGIYPDIVSISLLEQVGHFYKAGHSAEQTQIERLQNEIEDLTSKKLRATTLRNCSQQLKQIYRTGSDTEYKKMLMHVKNTLGVNVSLEKTLMTLLHFREIQPDYGAVVLYSCAMLECLLYELLIELRCRRLTAARDAAHTIVRRRKGGLRDRLQLLQDMCDTDLAELLPKLGYQDWERDWRKLSKCRNDILHKGAARIGASQADMAFDLAINATWVFAQVRNYLLDV